MKGIVLVTGVGMKEAKYEFTAPDAAKIVSGHTPGKKAKINAPAATAIELNNSDYYVYMVGECKNCLGRISEMFKNDEFSFKEANLVKKSDAEIVADELKSLKEKMNLPVHIVHYGGMSGTASGITLDKETVALDPWEVPSEAIGPYVDANCASFLNIFQRLRKTFSSQEITKIVFISAISAIRTKRLHTLDAIQKSAIHAMARSLALDLTKERIYVTEVMPGITDTGFYDDDETFKAMKLASEELGYAYDRDSFPLFSPKRVGETVNFVLGFKGHIREISMVPYGQYPHLGA